MNRTFYGYERENGKFGARNYVGIIPMVGCANEVADAIERQSINSRSLQHHQGCCQLFPDLERVTNCLIGFGLHPNVGAVLIVSLGCEGTDVEKVKTEIAKSGKPFECIKIQELGGMTAAIEAGTNLAQALQMKISAQQRVPVDIANYIMGIKCGASDTTSGFASNCVIGYLADKIVDLGGTVVFGETTEFIGAEHILAKRAKNEKVAGQIYQIVDDMEKRAKSLGCDMRKGQPTPGNIAGGLSSIEEKSLGAIVKSGTRTIQGVLKYDDIITHEKGLWIKDTPGREMEILTGMAVAGVQAMAFSTGRGAPHGFPIMPVIKICGNPNTYTTMKMMMDVNAGQVIEGKRSIEEVGEEIYELLLRVLSGETTCSESICYSKSMDIYTLGPVI